MEELERLKASSIKSGGDQKNIGLLIEQILNQHRKAEAERKKKGMIGDNNQEKIKQQLRAVGEENNQLKTQIAKYQE